MINFQSHCVHLTLTHSSKSTYAHTIAHEPEPRAGISEWSAASTEAEMRRVKKCRSAWVVMHQTKFAVTALARASTTIYQFHTVSSGPYAIISNSWAF